MFGASATLSRQRGRPQSSRPPVEIRCANDSSAVVGAADEERIISNGLGRNGAEGVAPAAEKLPSGDEVFRVQGRDDQDQLFQAPGSNDCPDLPRKAVRLAAGKDKKVWAGAQQAHAKNCQSVSLKRGKRDESLQSEGKNPQHWSDAASTNSKIIILKFFQD